MALPDPSMRFGVGNIQGLPAGVQLAYLSETILLALEEETRDYGIGNEVPLAEVDHVLALAQRHGVRLADPSTNGHGAIHGSVDDAALYAGAP